MSLRNTTLTYGSVAKFFHWLIFLLLFGMIIFGFLLDDIPKDSQPFAYNIHKLTGLTILTLMLLRTGWTLMNPKPVLPFDTLPWQRVAERVVHFLLYACVIAMPIMGWVGSTASGHAPHLGSINLALPIAEDKAFADQAFAIHNFLAFTIIALVTIHVAAAFYHHFIKRDNILIRMLPN